MFFKKVSIVIVSAFLASACSTMNSSSNKLAERNPSSEKGFKEVAKKAWDGTKKVTSDSYNWTKSQMKDHEKRVLKNVEEASSRDLIKSLNKQTLGVVVRKKRQRLHLQELKSRIKTHKDAKEIIGLLQSEFQKNNIETVNVLEVFDYASLAYRQADSVDRSTLADLLEIGSHIVQRKSRIDGLRDTVGNSLMRRALFEALESSAESLRFTVRQFYVNKKMDGGALHTYVHGVLNDKEVWRNNKVFDSSDFDNLHRASGYLDSPIIDGKNAQKISEEYYGYKVWANSGAIISNRYDFHLALAKVYPEQAVETSLGIIQSLSVPLSSNFNINKILIDIKVIQEFGSAKDVKLLSEKLVKILAALDKKQKEQVLSTLSSGGGSGGSGGGSGSAGGGLWTGLGFEGIGIGYGNGSLSSQAVVKYFSENFSKESFEEIRSVIISICKKAVSDKDEIVIESCLNDIYKPLVEMYKADINNARLLGTVSSLISIFSDTEATTKDLGLKCMPVSEKVLSRKDYSSALDELAKLLATQVFNKDLVLDTKKFKLIDYDIGLGYSYVASDPKAVARYEKKKNLKVETNLVTPVLQNRYNESLYSHSEDNILFKGAHRLVLIRKSDGKEYFLFPFEYFDNYQVSGEKKLFFDTSIYKDNESSYSGFTLPGNKLPYFVKDISYLEAFKNIDSATRKKIAELHKKIEVWDNRKVNGFVSLGTSTTKSLCTDPSGTYSSGAFKSGVQIEDMK